MYCFLKVRRNKNITFNSIMNNRNSEDKVPKIKVAWYTVLKYNNVIIHKKLNVPSRTSEHCVCDFFHSK